MSPFPPVQMALVHSVPQFILRVCTPYGMIGFLACLLVYVIGAIIFQDRRTKANLQKLAARLGLKFVPAQKWFERPLVTGTLRGKPIDFLTETTTGGESSTTKSLIVVKLAKASPLTLTLKERGLDTAIFNTMLAKWAQRGVHLTTVGDAELDQAWWVLTNQPEFIRAALIPELRAKLMKAVRAGMTGSFTIRFSSAEYAEVGLFSDAERAERFTSFADVVCDLADMAGVAAEGQGGGKLKAEG